MITVKTKENKNWAIPGSSLSADDFKAGIKKAEDDLFMTLDELKESVEEWKKNQNV